MARVSKNKFIKHNGKIDLACGDYKREGFTGIDKYKTDSTDYEIDLLQFPWPIESDSVDEVHCSHFFEHIPAKDRSKFMEEVHRILKVGSTAQFIVPAGDRCYQDFSHEWPPVVASSFLYWNQNWLKENKLMHGVYKTCADFDYSYGYSLHPNVASRNAEFQAYATQFYNNAATNLYVTLTKRKV